jgi:DNA polymerase-3 subunit epsilon/exodeoxyribonuclease X
MTLFLDLETTGLESNDKILSIALLGKDIEVYELVNNGKKIPPLASSINHITNEMIKDKPKLEDTKAYEILQVNNNKNTTIIGHNIKFDLEKLSENGFFFEGNAIDTLRVTKHLIPECEFFSLQFLRYELKLYRQEEKTLVAHNALDDVKVIKFLYEYLLDIESSKKMIELSTKNVLMQKLNFGKHNSKYIEDIAINDRLYLEWILLNIQDLDEDLKYSINYFLRG